MVWNRLNDLGTHPHRIDRVAFFPDRQRQQALQAGCLRREGEGAQRKAGKFRLEPCADRPHNVRFGMAQAGEHSDRAPSPVVGFVLGDRAEMEGVVFGETKGALAGDGILLSVGGHEFVA